MMSNLLKNIKQYGFNALMPLLFILLTSSVGWSQDIVVKGTILDENQLTLPGVNIQIKGTTKGTITGFDGNYEISVPNKEAILIFSSIGYKKEEIVVGEQTTINLQLTQDAEELEEIVVIGYGTQKVKDLTGSTGVLSSKDVDLQPIQRTQEMLQGKVAGVVVSQNSGAPGAAPKVNIRGFTGDPVYVIDGFIGGDINALNPSDIESMSVLKDASATAIYGSRGANGVVLITTKAAGKNKPMSVNFSYDHKISQLGRKLDLADPYNYMMLVNQKQELVNSDPLFGRSELKRSLEAGYGTDWQDEIFRIAHTNNYNLSIGKGWENYQVRVSLGANQSEGIILNSDYKKYMARVKLKSKLTHSTKLAVNLATTQETPHNIFQGGNRNDGANDIVASAIGWSPNLNVFDESTNDYTGFQGYGATVLKNPIYLAQEVNRTNENTILAGDLSLEQKITSDLKVKAFLGAQKRISEGSTFTRKAPAEAGAVDVLSTSETEAMRLQGNLQLQYAKDFNENHSIDATAVVEALKFESDKFTLRTVYDNLEQPTVDNTIPPVYNPEKMLSYLGRLNYTFKDKVLLTGSVRLDGSSRLHPDNKWGTFMSGAIAYRLSEEAFIKDIEFIESLKLRASYGETGNVNSVKAFQVQDLVNIVPGYTFGGVYRTGTAYEDGANRANPFLLWESSQQINMGVDFSLWEGILAVNADYYIKYTNDNHFNQEATGYMGGGSTKSNTGQLLNNGVEVQLSTKWIDGEDFKFNSSINVSFNQSEVLKLPQDTVFVGVKPSSAFDNNTHILVKGERVGQLYGYKFTGIDAENGEAIYEDLDKDGIITSNDMTVIGQGHPIFTWGFNANASYKQFSLSMFIQGVHGVDAFNLPKHATYGGGAGVLNATSMEGLDTWTPDNTNASLPALNANYRMQSSLFVEDASFVKLRNVTLAYDAPASLLDKIRLKSLRAFVSGQNLLTFTGYTGFDPEALSGTNLAPAIDKGSYPTPRTYVLGVKIGI